MEAFLFSAILSFIAYECLAFIYVPPQWGWFRIGDVTISFDQTSVRWAKRGLIAIVVFAFLLSVVFLHDTIFSIYQISRNKTNITLGLLFGPLFAIWLNSVFSSPPGQPLSRGQILGGIGLIVFCLIGSAGNQTGKVLEQLARKISGVKGLGFEFSLSDGARKKDSSQGATSIAGSKESRNFASGSGSVGLEYVSQLDDIIHRDKDYLTLLFGQTDARLLHQLDHAEALAKLAIKPPLKCLAAWFEFSADATFVQDHLSPFVVAFRQVSTLHNEQRRTAVSRVFIESMTAIALDVELFGAPATVEAGCARLLNMFCPANVKIDSDTDAQITNRPDLIECLRQNSTVGPTTLAASHMMELSEALGLFVAEKGLETRPYFAIAYASLMAQLGQYESAAAILDGWLSQKELLKENSPVVNGWFEIRARSMLAAYFAEWLLKQGNSAATVFRNEHLLNLSILRDGIENLLVKADFWSKANADERRGKGSSTFRVPDACSSKIAEPQLGLWRRLFSSYISMALTHVQNRLQHPYYKPMFVESANADIRRLIDMDLSCLSDYPPPALVYAQILDSYARNNLQYSKVKKDIESDDVREERLKLSDRAVAYGWEITKRQADSELYRTSGTFLTRVAPSDWVAAREALEQTGRDLRSARED